MLLNRVDSGREGGKVSLRFLTPSFVGDSTFKKKRKNIRCLCQAAHLVATTFLIPNPPLLAALCVKLKA